MKKKAKIYLDTSVISYLYQLDAPEKMQETLAFWEEIKQDEYEIIISETVIEELAGCNDEKAQILRNYLLQIPIKNLSLNTEILELSEIIIEEKILPPKSINDSRHIAFAIVNNCDYLVSWNMKHLANVKTNKNIRTLIIREQYKELLIVPPTMFLGDYRS
jgi:predicted nucleic acid-binding protein